MADKEMKENELDKVAGGLPEDIEWDFVVTCSCGYCQHFSTFDEAAEALLEHLNDNKSHSCSINVSIKK